MFKGGGGRAEGSGRRPCVTELLELQCNLSLDPSADARGGQGPVLLLDSCSSVFLLGSPTNFPCLGIAASENVTKGALG